MFRKHMVMVFLVYSRGHGDLEWSLQLQWDHPLWRDHPTLPSPAPPLSAAPGALSYPSASLADAGRTEKIKHAHTVTQILQTMTVWLFDNDNYLDEVGTGVLGDLFGHCVVELPLHVCLVNIHTLFYHHEGIHTYNRDVTSSL